MSAGRERETRGTHSAGQRAAPRRSRIPRTENRTAFVLADIQVPFWSMFKFVVNIACAIWLAAVLGSALSYGAWLLLFSAMGRS